MGADGLIRSSALDNAAGWVGAASSRDLWVAIVIMGGVSGFAGVVAHVRLRKRTDRAAPLTLVLMLVSAVGFVFGLKDHLVWARWIPVSAAVIYSNAVPVLLAIAAGLAACLPQRPVWRRSLGAVALGAIAVVALVQPVLQPLLRPIEGSDRWTPDGVALQTRAHTCSAAAGATLLGQVGIRVSEGRMVELCLTDARGTPSLGLWRGLCLATADHDVHPVASAPTARSLIDQGPFPSVVVVGLPPGEVDRKYIEQYGWAPGFRHSVVLLGHDPDQSRVFVADPAYGRETWSEEDFELLFRGEAIHLRPS